MTVTALHYVMQNPEQLRQFYDALREIYGEVVDYAAQESEAIAVAHGYTGPEYAEHRNAIAHAYESAQLALSVEPLPGGAGLAWLLGGLKELLSLFDSNSDLVKDLYNNEVGRRIGEFIRLNGLDPSAAEALVIDALESGDLVTNPNDSQLDSPPTWSRPSYWPEPLPPPPGESLADKLRNLIDDAKNTISDLKEKLPNWKNDLKDLLRDILGDPIVLDLDGDGIELTSLAQSATMFDLDGDGVLERTAWVSPQDGLLVHDANGNGTVDGVAELFGSSNVDGYDELKTLDSNSDGRIDTNDAAFAELRVWRDLNSDGISTPDELQSLADAGITRLNLAYNQVDQDDNGNLVARLGSFVRTDGTTRSMASVNFALEEMLPIIPAGADVSGLGLLPNLAGEPGLPDLRTAMFFDPTLRAMVEDLVYGDHDFDSFAEFLDGGFLDVLYRWAGIDTSVPLGPEDPPFSLQLLSAFMGRPFEELNSHQIERLEEEAWPQLLQDLGAKFLFQSAQLPAVKMFFDLLNDLVAVDPNSPTYLETIAAMTEAAINEAASAGPAYDYLNQFTGLSFDPSTGELTGDFDAFVAAFIDDQPSFNIYLPPSGGGGSGGAGGISLYADGEENPFGVEIPWNDWFQDQGKLLFSIGQMMGFGEEYVLNLTGWKWLEGGFSEHYGTSGDDMLDFTVTTFERPVSLFSFQEESGTTRDQMLYGYEGNDELRGNDGVDRLIGGLGDDLLKGGSGSDYYVYASGDGLDRITETSGADDTIYFSSELNSADLQVARVAGTNDLLLHFGNPAQGIILTSQWSSSSLAIEHFQFVGENGLDAGDIASLYLATLTTTGADTIVGSWAGERIFGGDGNDTLNGGAGDDSLSGNSGDDALDGGSSDDLLDGGSGNDLLKGGTGGDVLLAGSGNDQLQGGDQSDTYVYNVGDGDDVIYDYQQSDSTATDTLTFGNGIAPTDIVFSRTTDSADMRISFANAGGSILVNNQWWGDAGIESITFADGTVWTHAEIAARYVAAQSTSAADTIWGTNLADVAEGGAGNDTIKTFGTADTLIGGTGNDQLEGGDQSDTYVYNSGDGDDVIYDYQQSDSTATDTLIFGEGITPDDIVFSRTTDSADMRISFANAGGSIIVNNQWWGDAGLESISFADGTVWTHAEIAARYVAAQSTSAADTIWGTNHADVADGGAGNDTIKTFGTADTLIGGAGNDRLEGGDQSDAYIYNLGDGDDVIYDYQQSDSTATDTLIFGVGIAPGDLVFSRTTDSSDVRISFSTGAGSIILDNQWWGDAGVESIQFSDGTVWTQADIAERYVAAQSTSGNDTIWGSSFGDVADGGASDDFIGTVAGNDTLIGGLGNDMLQGNTGADTYAYNVGDGDDVIYDYKQSDGTATDVLVFGEGITIDDVIFSRPAGDTTDLLITFQNQAGSILIDHQTWSDAGIELFQFWDGSTLTAAQAALLIGG